MKKVIEIDGNGYFVSDKIIKDNEAIPQNCIPSPCPDGLYKPMWTGTEWVEGATQEEIDEIKNVVQIPTVEERLACAEAVLMDMIEMMMV